MGNGTSTFTVDRDCIMLFQCQSAVPTVKLNGVQLDYKFLDTTELVNSGVYRYYYNILEVKTGDVVSYFGSPYAAVEVMLFVYE